MTRRLPIAALLCALAAEAWAQTDQPPGLPAEVVTVESRPLTASIAAVGTLAANEQIWLRPEQSGRVLEIRFSEGKPVSAGEVMIELDASIYRAELHKAQAQLNQSRRAYDRAQSLLSRKVGSETERDSALARLKVDEAEVELARTRLDKMTLRAPFAGLTGLRQISPGDYVAIGQDLVALVDNRSMKVDFRIPEIYLPALRPGLPVRIQVDAFPGRRFEGSVYAIAPGADAQSHSLRLRARIANPEGLLRPGLFAQIQLQAGETAAALFVPEQAIIPGADGSSVLRVNAEQQVERVAVELGQRRPGEVQVLSGLSTGDIVVTAGQLKLRPGMPVTPVHVDNNRAPTP
ncbi:MexH family multidrug efflux RND transporter periplasmic adaptor subunit [Marinobacterium nitratireducens]|uniref:MexH family multidrug efflux RND transporter periplasmic adaptor subunit n=1 Tax=Marinobacterium nitratireducens TaxID=518897 RepID=A0A917ZB47_9GAMM|nr:efflux RND transporter periplasmic adaptor subunit [Marinobacterium nitratireducens]GGO79408.1 MexH family multidrug efflux RND transporter periplasmic adaptor subunit [Marinobacterium nitratireducens]